MIISRTPFRVSFVGGGTDLESFYSRDEGMVLSASIDKFIYVAVKRQMDIVEHKYRVSWSQVEFRDSIDEIQHPIVRETLKLLKIDFPIEITTFADIPANTGLGSSSSFAVGLLHALFALQGKVATKATIAKMAAEIEIDILKRNIGVQDHYAAAYGNLNVFRFQNQMPVMVEPVFYRGETKRQIEQNLMLFYTRLKRDANTVLEVQNKATADKMDTLRQMRDLVHPMREIFCTGKNVSDFGRILHRAWELKRSLTQEISSGVIDEYYDRAMAAGALGGKLLGAGGGGFILFYVEPEKQESVRKALSDLYQLNFRFDDAGTRITYYDERG